MMVVEALRGLMRMQSFQSGKDGSADPILSGLQHVSVETDGCTSASSKLFDEESADHKLLNSVTSYSKCSNEKSTCLTASFPTLVVLALVLISIVLGRQYVIDILIYIDSLNWWESMVLFGVMFTMVAFPIMSGYVLLNIACGYTYGFLYGSLMTSGCAAYAIICSHFIMRKFCKNYVERTYLVNAQTRALMEVVSGRNGYKIVFLMRFTPIPFGVQNAIFAVSGIKTLPYLLSSVLGLSITQMAYSYMGSRFRSIAEVFSSDNSIATWILLSIQVAVTFGLTIFVLLLAKRELEKKVPPIDTTVSNTQSKGSQTVSATEKFSALPSSKPRSHSRNMSVNIPPIIASGVHVV